MKCLTVPFERVAPTFNTKGRKIFLYLIKQCLIKIFQ